MDTAPASLGFEPRLGTEDPLAAYWLRLATLRMRRQIAWLWHGRGGGGTLPPPADRLSHALELTRFAAERARFFAEDPTGAWLTAALAAPPPDGPGMPPPPRGGFGWAVRTLKLDPAARFVLALALLAAADGAAGPVFAACTDSALEAPSLALAQRLWDAPQEIAALADPAHPLARSGLLAASPVWDAPLLVAPVVARQLLHPTAPMPPGLAPLPAPVEAVGPEALTLAVARLKATQGLRVLPLLGGADAPFASVAAGLAAALGARGAVLLPGATPAPLAVVAWLRGLALHLPPTPEGTAPPALPELPLVVMPAVTDRTAARAWPKALPPLVLAPPDYRARLAAWQEGLPDTRSPEMARAVADCARRFRLETPAISRICHVLHALGRPVKPGDLEPACRADLDLGDLAQPVVPRFRLAELMLPAKQSRQIEEIRRAAAALTEVHHEWGMERAWNGSGLSCLFSGPPGTGKTMAAEALANDLGLPLHRIDLSQVVNKYIGETEKNLKRLFDAADAADTILFFDEADALFGKRGEVRDSHDRYANLEISYLLERMERFRGFAILATNRRRDLDEAFLRRLRFAVEFPLPGPDERLRIWEGAIPSEVDRSALDLRFLANRFALAGGHIRSAVFQACLQSAAAGGARRLEMTAVAGALRRELEKLGRPISLDSFGPYAACLEDGP